MVRFLTGPLFRKKLVGVTIITINTCVLVRAAAGCIASYPGSCGGGEKRAWYRPFAHALNYKLKNHVFVANDV